VNAAVCARNAALGLLTAAAVACSSLGRDPGPLATSVLAPDYSTYSIARVGLLPFAGSDIDPASAAALQEAFQSELSGVMPYEIVPLSHSDLVEVRASDAYRRGRYDPRSILEIARRYRLDALVLGTVTQFQPYPPQALGLEIEMLATETGTTLWSSSLQVDANDGRVRARLERWQNGHTGGGGTRESVQLTLVSPERFARFAAAEVAAATRVPEGAPGAVTRSVSYLPRASSQR
jgi:hypothetical protein